MELFDVIVLAAVQGLTEFLPVSSSGHLVIARALFGIPDVEGTAFDAVLHLGTLASVLVFYRKVWWGIIRSVFYNDTDGKDKRELFAKLAIATVPAAIAGYVVQQNVESFFRSPSAVAVGLLITAAVLASSDSVARRALTITRARFKDALLIGLVQVVALVPGISRSGVTIAAGRWCGLSKKQAANFSFLLSAPIIAGAGLSSVRLLIAQGGFSTERFVVGILVSFVFGILAIFSLLKFIERMSFIPFVIYLVIVAGILFVA